MKEKVGKLDRAIIIKLSKRTSGKSLLEFKKVVDNRLQEKINTFESMLLTNLQAYLEIVLPKLQTIQFSNTLELVNGLNIVDLERFSRDVEVQSLIISSVLEEVLHSHKGVIVVIPEAWKFIPQKRGNPCKVVVEEFIRQGATNGNYLWIDSQDMSGVDKIPLKQISEWILGYQSEMNEVKHTLDQIPLPKQNKPKEDEIMTLGTGIMIFASRDLTAKVYVQPFWLNDEKAIQIAKGELKITEIDAPERIVQSKIAIQSTTDDGADNEEVKQLKQLVSTELTGIRKDFFDKIGDIQDQINKLFVDFTGLKTSAPEINEDELVGKILQKIPQQNHSSNPVDTETIVKAVLARVPKSTGNQVYEVAPLEKIKKDFLEEAKQKILSDVGELSDDAKKTLKYLEVKSKLVKTSELVEKCFLMKAGGSSSKKINTASLQLCSFELARKGTHSDQEGCLKTRIQFLIGNHDATEQEIENLYQHILMEML